MTNTRIFCALRRPACGGVIPVSPRQQKTCPRDGPPPPPPPPRGGTGKWAHVEWRRD